MSSNEDAKGLRERILAHPCALNAKEVAQIFGLSLQSVYSQARSGSMPSFLIGTSRRFDPKKLADWYERQ